MLGYWPSNTTYRSYHTIVDWRWIVMELGTLAVGAAVLWRWRLPLVLLWIVAIPPFPKLC